MNLSWKDCTIILFVAVIFLVSLNLLLPKWVIGHMETFSFGYLLAQVSTYVYTEWKS